MKEEFLKSQNLPKVIQPKSLTVSVNTPINTIKSTFFSTLVETLKRYQHFLGYDSWLARGQQRRGRSSQFNISNRLFKAILLSKNPEYKYKLKQSLQNAKNKIVGLQYSPHMKCYRCSPNEFLRQKYSALLFPLTKIFSLSLFFLCTLTPPSLSLSLSNVSHDKTITFHFSFDLGLRVKKKKSAEMGGIALRVEGRISIKAMELHGEAVNRQLWKADKQ